jgi:hypothetical protein
MKKTTPMVFLIFLTLLTIGCAGSESRKAAPVWHPRNFKGLEGQCSECHEWGSTDTGKPHGTFHHSRSFLQRHGTYAAQDQDLCNSCHGDSFCMDCHATEGGIRPDIRHGNQPDRDLMPHRGDYLTQHRIDGRVNPGSCVRCHGNRNSETCARCHK